MRRILPLVAVAVLSSGAVQAQRLEIAPTRASNATNPIPTRPGELIASELSEIDAASGVERSAEWFIFTGRAGEVITLKVRSDVPTLEVLVRSASSRTGRALVEGPAKDAPLRLVLPADGAYVIVVHSRGPQRFGEYLLSLGLGDTAPDFEPPRRAPVQVAQPAPAPALASPAILPPMPAIPGVTNIQVGQTLTRPPGGTGNTIELYAFIGEAGSSLHVTAEGAAGYGLTLYTPEGAEMLTATGQVTARLDAILPKDGIYLLAVARQDAARPFRLALSAESPNAMMWLFRNNVGYEDLAEDGSVVRRSCWVEPGTVLRYDLPDSSVAKLTMHPGGAGRWDVISRNGQSYGYNFTTRLEGTTVIRTSESGVVQTWQIDDLPSRQGAYGKYLCE